MNIGDVVFQLVMLIFLLGLSIAFFYAVRAIIRGSRKSENKAIEQKLDKIIELLEKEK